jgi:hypothetical protein
MGDSEKAFAAAPVKIDVTYSSGRRRLIAIAPTKPAM